LFNTAAVVEKSSHSMHAGELLAKLFPAKFANRRASKLRDKCRLVGYTLLINAVVIPAARLNF